MDKRPYSKEQKALIEELGALFFTEEEIEAALSDDESMTLEQLAMKGRVNSEYRVRKSIFDLAESGSAPAQSLVMQIIKNYKIYKIRK
jgi:hypothetical protein